jgi:hypothetical protein
MSGCDAAKIFARLMWNAEQSDKEVFGKGCQIFLGSIYQYGENYTKSPQNLPYVHENINWS